MDLLSRLLSLIPVTGRLELRCLFGAPWKIDQAVSGVREIPYHVLLSGHAVLEDVNGPSEQLTAGDIILFPAGNAHLIHDGSGATAGPESSSPKASLTVIENDGAGEKADFLCGRFLLGAVPDRLLRDHLPGRLVVHSALPERGGDIDDPAQSMARTRLRRLIELMHEEANDPGAGSEMFVNHLSAALFALTLRFATEGAQPPHGLLALSRKPRLQPAITAMFETPAEPWTLDQLSTLCHMSRATFIRQFQEAIGRSAADVLTEVRMTIAGRMLLHADTPVAEVGESVGYQSVAAFQRVFKRHVGVSPARWRSSGGNLQA
ncbi:AraC family transcriptional regulator [Paraburkholderia megapolitana]|uniref:Transcriptional regulator, AraC family n=1 Tax=Paraburkholderia megapolitana TaxID=420953 RepID=A0A1I3QAN8_9BURK|nr:AraC family transcriptional regulator [Paraburkholderia megapolitana]QDQ81166.1 AraC family transcriptional regulator [Paraburkholderia megapolitana]SFJ30755.1 transcriptional regulator, AraC family [Paraburkholderia megapolitana]